MKYKLQTYINTIWQEVRKGARIWHFRRIIHQMHQERDQKKDLLNKIARYIKPDVSNQREISLALQTLKLNNEWLFKGVRTAFKRGWMLKLKKLEKISRKNQTLLLENFLLLGKDILRPRDFKVLRKEGLVYHLDDIEREIIERYLLDKKKRVRAKMQNFLLAAPGPYLARSIRGAKARARTRWQRFFFHRKIKDGLEPVQIDKDIQLTLMSSAFNNSITDLLSENDYLREGNDPFLKYLYTAMIYNNPKRKKTFTEDSFDEYELLKDIRRKAGG